MRVEPYVGEMPPAECWEKMRGGSIGRLALSARALPVIIPVRYVVDGTTVVMGMGAEAPFDAAVDGVVVAFSVESIDEVTASGWCVHLQGIVRVLSPSGGGPGAAAGGPVLALEPASVVGRYLTLSRPVAPGSPAAAR